MDPLAGRDKVLGFRGVHFKDVIRKDTRSIDYYPARYLILFSGQLIRNPYTPDLVSLFYQLNYFCVIHTVCTVCHCSPGQVNGQSGVIKLAVIIEDPAPEPLSSQRRKLFNGQIIGESSGRPQIKAACKQIINFQSDTVKRPLPPPVIRNEKSLPFNKVRGIFY